MQKTDPDRDTESPTPTDAIFAIMTELGATERGFVLGALLTATEDAPSVADHLSGSRSATAHCREAITAIAAVPRAERVRWMGVLAREALAPLPAGIEDVAEDVLLGAMKRESPWVIRLIMTQAPPVLRRVAAAALTTFSDDDAMSATAADIDAIASVRSDVVAELLRAILSDVDPVPSASPQHRPQRLARRLATLPPADLLTELTAVGAALLGSCLRGADDVTLERALARAGPSWSTIILHAARGPLSGGDDEATHRQRARRLSSAVAPGDNTEQTLARLGAREVGDRLGHQDPDLVWSIAQRLPPDVRRELVDGAKAHEC